MKKIIILVLLLAFLLSCDLSTSLAPEENIGDMAATVNSIMTELPTMEEIATQTEDATSAPTLLAPVPSIDTFDVGTPQPTLHSGTAQATFDPNHGATIETTATMTATITPTFIPGDPRGTLGPYSWVDTYANGNNWPQGNDQYTSVVFEDGFMKLTALTDTYGWRLTYPELKNFYMEANFQTPSCQETDHYGIIFRVPDISTADEGYFYGIQCNGKYFLKVYSEKNMTSLVFAKSSLAILPGKEAVNRLGVMAVDNKITLYINGVLVKEIEDDLFSSGGFGIFVRSVVEKNLSVWVDEIAYWSLP
ncbi:MAG: hypothetical protein JXR32_06185 [Anaerolineaceae bacterium]|nr:hypothetical protein [Anaerolineaceae bacterium]